MASPFRHFCLSAPPRRPARARLALEPLEDRTVPAPFIVTNLNDGGAGSLRQAITAANAAADADTITFAAGLTGTINLTVAGLDDTNAGGDLDILNPVSIQGPGANVLKVNQTVANERVFEVRPGAGASVSISGLTISGGNGANGSGAGVHLATAATLTLSAVEVTGNSTSNGFGGGVDEDLDGSVLTIINSTIANNSTLNANGGGIEIVLGSAAITNSTISGNTAGGAVGGGVRNSGGNLTISNSTITGNSAPTGAGISIGGGATVTLSSTIVAGNKPAAAGDVAGTVLATSDHNLIGVDTGLLGITNGVNGNLVGTAATPINPLLGPLQLNGGPTRTHALLAGSPALDNGSDSADFSDQRGFPFLRLAGAGVDIGAFEVQPNPGPTSLAVVSAIQVIRLLQPSGARFAAAAFADVNGDFVNDIVLAFRLRSNKLLIVTIDGLTNQVLGAFVPFPARLAARARLQLLTLNLVGDTALEIALIVNSGGPGVPRVSAFTGTGARVL
jgi:hypothetical protein